MPPARRFAGGWILSNLVDDDGAVQALTVFDARFATLAFSTGITGERQVTPIDDHSLWANIDDTIERWVIDGRRLVRAQHHPMRACWLLGYRLVIDHQGTLTARGPDGAQLWTWQRATTGASYGVATTSGVLVYDDTRAHLLDRDGHLVRSFAVEFPDVRVGSGGTVYLKTTDQLWILRDQVRAIEVALDSELMTTCGDRALLARGAGRFELIAPDGRRAGFTASGATFSSIGTAGGPYV